MSDDTRPNQETGRILRFARRGALVRGDRSPYSGSAEQSPVEDVGKYARSREDDGDDYRHRMIINILALVFVIALIVCGVWLFDALVKMRKLQDCALTGRRNCATLEIPSTPRF